LRRCWLQRTIDFGTLRPRFVGSSCKRQSVPSTSTKANAMALRKAMLWSTGRRVVGKVLQVHILNTGAVWPSSDQSSGLGAIVERCGRSHFAHPAGNLTGKIMADEEVQPGDLPSSTTGGDGTFFSERGCLVRYGIKVRRPTCFLRIAFIPPPEPHAPSRKCPRRSPRCRTCPPG